MTGEKPVEWPVGSGRLARSYLGAAGKSAFVADFGRGEGETRRGRGRSGIGRKPRLPRRGRQISSGGGTPRPLRRRPASAAKGHAVSPP